MAVGIEKFNPNQNYAVVVQSTSTNGAVAAVAINQAVGNQPFPTNYGIIRVFQTGSSPLWMRAGSGTNTATATAGGSDVNSVPIAPNQFPEKFEFNSAPTSLSFAISGTNTSTAFVSVGNGGV